MVTNRFERLHCIIFHIIFTYFMSVWCINSSHFNEDNNFSWAWRNFSGPLVQMSKFSKRRISWAPWEMRPSTDTKRADGVSEWQNQMWFLVVVLDLLATVVFVQRLIYRLVVKINRHSHSILLGLTWNSLTWMRNQHPNALNYAVYVDFGSIFMLFLINCINLWLW